MVGLEPSLIQVEQFSQALKYLNPALEIFREIQAFVGEWNTLGNLGDAYEAIGNYAKAFECYKQSLTITRKIKDHRGEEKILVRLLEYLQVDLEVFRAIQDRQSEEKTLVELGLAYCALGDYAKAIECNQQHLAIVQAT